MIGSQLHKGDKVDYLVGQCGDDEKVQRQMKDVYRLHGSEQCMSE